MHIKKIVVDFFKTSVVRQFNKRACIFTTLKMHMLMVTRK